MVVFREWHVFPHHQLLKTINNHHQPSSAIIRHHQPSLATTMNHYYPCSNHDNHHWAVSNQNLPSWIIVSHPSDSPSGCSFRVAGLSWGEAVARSLQLFQARCGHTGASMMEMNGWHMLVPMRIWRWMDMNDWLWMFIPLDMKGSWICVANNGQLTIEE